MTCAGDIDATMRCCTLCPRRCRADRVSGPLGVCRAGSVVKVFRWGPHFGEEPPISGSRGSGTVFFSHCPLGCIYCQNHPWTAGGLGDEVGVAGLAGILRDLAAKGCHNWNLVTPEPWMPQIREAVEKCFDGAKVERVNTMNIGGKKKRRGRSEGYTADKKKAIVKLTADSKDIEIYQGL